eukprot:Gb_31768 [translate_table: standard]
MGDAYWRYAAERGVRDFPGYPPRENLPYDDRINHSLWRTHDPLGAPTDALRNGISPYGAGGLTASEIGSLGGGSGIGLGVGSGIGLSGVTSGTGYGGLTASSLDDPILRGQRQGVISMDSTLMGRPPSSELYSARPDTSLKQPDNLKPDVTSNTLFVEGLPTDCTRREVAHIFRPFIGFKQIRVIHKEPRRGGGEPYVLCFVEYADAKCAATVLEALQGYKFDDTDEDSAPLRLQYARFPGSRATPAPVRDDLLRGS